MSLRGSYDLKQLDLNLNLNLSFFKCKYEIQEAPTARMPQDVEFRTSPH